MKTPIVFLILSSFFSSIFYGNLHSQVSVPGRVIAYWHGSAEEAEKYPIEKITHIIYSFLHLEGNILFDTKNDSIQLSGLSRLKQRNPDLKILVSLGGWGGCETCPLVFSTAKGCKDFSQSVKKILEKYQADGIDLDWEYPALPSLPGHPYSPEDKQNFTLLIQTLREILGNKYEISFAAGGFEDFMERSVEWEKVMPLVNYVNLMNYDIVNGNSTTTGHHTPLYSNDIQKSSTHYTVEYLRNIGVDKEKIIIGAAFYGRLFSEVDGKDNGIYKQGKFNAYVNYKDIEKTLNSENGFEFFYDENCMASWAYNKTLKIFATFDDKNSIQQKTKYVKDNGLGGIMFWSLNGDKYNDGLLDTIYDTLKDRE